jgi:hypothetical protein
LEPFAVLVSACPRRPQRLSRDLLVLQKLIECPANDLVAFARSGCQPLAVDDLDSSASIAYEAPRLQRLCGQCHARSAQPKHIGQPFLAERDGVVLALLFTAHLLARTLRVEEDLVDQLFNSSEKRLARALLLLANFGKDGRHEPVIANVSQETPADMIGTTRSRVSHFMNKFRQLGYINYNGDLEVHSSLLDAVLHEKPQTIKAPR